MASLFQQIARSMAALAFGTVGVCAADEAPAVKSGSISVYIGTYTGKKSKGIYLLHLDPATGKLTEPELAGEMGSPSFLAIHPNHKFLYACGEAGKGSIGGFAIEKDGKLKFINQEPAAGVGACYVAVDPAGKNVLEANYSAGNVALLPIDEEGRLSPVSSMDQHAGPTPTPKPLGHFIDTDPSGRFALACDPGLQRIYVYRLDSANHKLIPNDPPYATVAPKSGPRHLAFTPDGKFAYAINEQGLSVTAFAFDAEHGVLHEIQTISTHPEGFTGKGLSTAELVCHPSGKFLYGSNRGHDSIAGFAIDSHSGKLTLISITPTGGKTPRGFGIDPTGQWLIAGNQGSDTLVEFHIDTKTGELKATGASFEVGAPVCVKFMEAGH
jgi:6-phosphogluconolactonase